MHKIIMNISTTRIHEFSESTFPLPFFEKIGHPWQNEQTAQFAVGDSSICPFPYYSASNITIIYLKKSNEPNIKKKNHPVITFTVNN